MRDTNAARPVLEVRPGAGIGPIDIGMTRGEARSAAVAETLSVDDFRRSHEGVAGLPDMVIGGQLFAYFEGGDRVVEAEVAVSGPLRVTCLDLDLSAPFPDVIDAMATHGRVDPTDPAFPASSVYPELGLALWADSKPRDLAEVAVEAILVRSPEPYLLD
jgi:hypothetical protein